MGGYGCVAAFRLLHDPTAIIAIHVTALSQDSSCPRRTEYVCMYVLYKYSTVWRLTACYPYCSSIHLHQPSLRVHPIRLWPCRLTAYVATIPTASFRLAFHRHPPTTPVRYGVWSTYAGHCAPYWWVRNCTHFDPGIQVLLIPNLFVHSIVDTGPVLRVVLQFPWSDNPLLIKEGVDGLADSCQSRPIMARSAHGLYVQNCTPPL